MGLLNKTIRILLVLFVLLCVIFSSCKNSSENLNTTNNSALYIEQQLINAEKISKTSLKNGLTTLIKIENETQKIKNDTLQIKCSLLIAKLYCLQGKNSEAIQRFDAIKTLSEKIGYHFGICSSQLETGIINYNCGKYVLSFENFSTILPIAKKYHFQTIEANAYNYIGKYFHTTGNFDQSVIYYQKSFELLYQLGNSRQSASVLLSLGKTYLNNNNIYMALQCYFDAYKSIENSSDLLEISDVCNHLGSIYNVLEQNDKALEYHRKALQIRINLGNPDGMAKSFNNLGETYLSLNNTDSARLYFENSLNYCKKTNYKKGIVKALTNLGKVYLLQKRFKEAGNFILKAYKLSTEAGYSNGIAETSLALGNLNLADNNFKQALDFFTESSIQSSKSRLAELEPDIYQGLYRCYSEMGNYKQALEYLQKFTIVQKNMLIAENNRQLAELRLTFDTEKKEKDNQVLRKENELNEMSIKRKSVIIWLTIVVLAFTILLCFYIYSRFNSKRIANLQLEELNEKITRQNLKLEVLNNELTLSNTEKDKILSIIAHELRNPLFWFQNLAEVLSRRFQQMSPDKIQKSLNSLDEAAKNSFHLMDNLLHWSRSRLNRITPHYEMHPLHYLITESTRMFDNILKHKEINLKLNVPKSISVNVDPNLFTCVVRNLVSNAIKFTPEKGTITINSTEKETFFFISICDSGVGISNKMLNQLFNPEITISHTGFLNEKGTGFGLKLCKEFVEINRGKIWAESNEGQGTMFTFSIPRCN